MFRELPVEIEPELWNVVFHRDVTCWWHRLLPGEFKHVFAYAYIPELDLFMVYDVWRKRTRIVLLPHCGRAIEGLSDMTTNAEVVKFRARIRAGVPFAAFSCVSTIKHLLGIRSVAVTPSGLYRCLIKLGGETSVRRRATETASRPASSSAA